MQKRKRFAFWQRAAKKTAIANDYESFVPVLQKDLHGKASVSVSKKYMSFKG